MKAWLQQNIVALIIVLASASSVYAAMRAEQAVDRAEIEALQRTVRMHDNVLSEIPALKRDIEYVTLEVSQLKPIMSGLTEGINNLNVTLAKLEVKLEQVNPK